MQALQAGAVRQAQRQRLDRVAVVCVKHRVYVRRTVYGAKRWEHVNCF